MVVKLSLHTRLKEDNNKDNGDTLPKDMSMRYLCIQASFEDKLNEWCF